MMRPASTSKKAVRPCNSGAPKMGVDGMSVGGVGLHPSTSSTPQPIRRAAATSSSFSKGATPLATRPINVSKSPSFTGTNRAGSTATSISSSSSSAPRKHQEGSIGCNNNTGAMDTPKFSAAERGQLVCIDQDTMDAIERRLSEEAMLDLRNEKIAARRAEIQAAEATKQAQTASRMRAGAERRARVKASNFL